MPNLAQGTFAFVSVCPGRSPATFRQRPGRVPAASRQRPGNVPAMFRQFSFNGLFVRFFVRMQFLFENVCTRLCPGWHHQSPPKFQTNILWWYPAMSRQCPGSVPAASWQRPRNVPAVSRKRTGNVSAASRQRSSNVPGAPQQRLGGYKRSAKTTHPHIFIFGQNCCRIGLVRFRLERLQKLTFYNQIDEEN